MKIVDRLNNPVSAIGTLFYNVKTQMLRSELSGIWMLCNVETGKHSVKFQFLRIVARKKMIRHTLNVNIDGDQPVKLENLIKIEHSDHVVNEFQLRVLKRALR